MSAIEDVHEELDADVSAEEFEEMVAEKVEEMGGLADDETAAMLVAHELEDEGGEVESVADVEPGMDDVKFVAKLVSIGEKRTFERDGDQPDGQVVNTEVADESGRIRLSLWDEMAESALEELEEGDVLRIAGRPKEGYNGVEVSADKAEIDPDVEIDVSLSDSYTVEELSMGLSDVTLVGKLLDVDDDYRTFDRDDGTEGRVGNVAIGDETGRIRVTLWDEGPTSSRSSTRAPWSRSSTATSASARATSNSTSAPAARSRKSTRTWSTSPRRPTSTRWRWATPSTSPAR